MNNNQRLALSEFAKLKQADLCFVDGLPVDNPFQAALDEIEQQRKIISMREAHIKELIAARPQETISDSGPEPDDDPPDANGYTRADEDWFFDMDGRG